MRNAGLEEAQAGIKIAGRNINNIRYPSRFESRAGFFASTRDECLSPRVRLVCNPEIPVALGEVHWLLDTSLDEVLALQSLESNPQLSFATRMEDWTCLGQHKRQPEFPVVTRESPRNSRKTTWLPRHRKMKPFPATAPQEKSHVRKWRSKGHLAPLMRPTKFPEIPVSLERNTEVFRHPLL